MLIKKKEKLLREDSHCRIVVQDTRTQNLRENFQNYKKK